MQTNVIPENLITASLQMESLVARVAAELAARGPQILSIAPSGSDEGSIVASAFATTQGVDMFMAHATGAVNLARAGEAVGEAGADYLKDDATSASSML